MRILRAAWRPWWLSLAFASPVLAQQPEPTPLPPTTVVGERPAQPGNPFPAQPLPSDYAVTPTRTEAPLGQFGGSVTAIRSEQWQNFAPLSVSDVLRQVPGLEVVRGGGPGQVTSVFMRGGDSNFTKVLLDGIPLNDPSSPGRAFNFGDLTVDNLARLEVLRGPQSSLYGSDALGGVINLVTARGEGPMTITSNTLGGHFGTFRQSLTASGGDERFYYSLGSMYYDTHGFSAGSKNFGNTEPDIYRNRTLSSRTGWNITPDLNVDVVTRYIRAATGLDSFVGFNNFPTDDPIRELKNEYFYGRTQGSLRMLDGLVDTRIGANLANVNRYDNVPGFGDGTFHGQTRKFDWLTNFQLLEGNRFSVGVDYQQEEADTTSLKKQRLTDRAIYVQDQISLFDCWFTTVGARWDDYSTVGSAFTYRAASLFRIKETDTAFKGSIGTAFIAPSLFDLYAPFFGNPDLKPEESKGWEYGVEQGFFDHTMTLGATYFRNDFTNLIVFGPGPFFSPENRARARTSGVEVTSSVQLTEKTKLWAAYTFLQTRDLETGQELVRRPRDRMSVTLQQLLLNDRLSLDLSVRWVAHRFDFVEGFSQKLLEDYTVVDVAASYQLLPNVRLFARVDNLFNENYEETFGFGTPTVSVYGGVEVKLGPAY